jgi:acetyl-CoA acyltransferase
MVTAGNSSPMNDGASFVIVMSERMIKRLGITPKSRLLSYAAIGVDPEFMGIGPVNAIPISLKKAGLKINDIDLIELNEAFAAQTLAVIRELNLNTDKINVNGGAIALGHPLGATGAKLTTQLINEMIHRDVKYGMVTACVGGGQGVAGIFENLNYKK